MKNKQPVCSYCRAFLKRVTDEEFSFEKDGVKVNVLPCKRCGRQSIEIIEGKGLAAALKRTFKATKYRILNKYPNTKIVCLGDDEK